MQSKLFVVNSKIRSNQNQSTEDFEFVFENPILIKKFYQL